MSKSTVLALGLGVGALVSPLAQVLAARYAGRRWLEITTQENR